MLKFVSYDNDHKQTEPVKLPKEVESVGFSYDGGRLSVSVNGKEVFSSYLGGSDCNIELDNK